MTLPSGSSAPVNPTKRGHKLARSRGRLLKALAPGFRRAVFAAPQAATGSGEAMGDDLIAEEVIEGPGAEPIAASELKLLFEQANDAADRGLVKQTWILASGDQLQVDARHGFVKKKKFDEARVQKVMAGKDRALRPDSSAELLRALGIMKADGSIPAKKAKKYKQVNHLVELARPTLEHLETHSSGPANAPATPLRIVDLACGNAYLSFVLAETLRLAGKEFELLGVDIRPELVATCQARAAELGWSQLHFETAEISRVEPQRLAGTSLLLALHACDTASDSAIALGLRAGVDAMWIVPCCHAQLAKQLERASGPSSDPTTDPASSQLPFDCIRDAGLLRRAYGETLTDALRVEVLRACGYEVSLVEFVGSEHTPKNLLIRAHRKRGRRSGKPAFDNERSQRELDNVRARCKAMAISPALLDELARTSP